jgi:AP-3 complex subunit delta-1
MFKRIPLLIMMLVKYVALLAFNKIVLTHPYLVAQQEDVIMECIDSPDISIRLRALDLVVGMVNSDNLMSIVGRLMRQLKNSRSPTAGELNHVSLPIEPAADSDDESPEVAIRADKGGPDAPLLPDDYKIDVINRILDMCSSNNYGNLADFDWYIDILTQLVRTAPIPTFSGSQDLPAQNLLSSIDVSERIGDELRTVSVKVKAIRSQTVSAAESILISTCNDNSSSLTAGSGVLRPVCWVVGEYAPYLSSPESTLTALLLLAKGPSPSESLYVFLQAIMKIFSHISGDDRMQWTPERKTMISLLMARIIHALEPLAMHPDLEVQERAVEFSELMKLAAEASQGQEVSTEIESQDAPLLLTQALPSLFSGMELNSVAVGAQKNVPIPPSLDLDQPINPNLATLLREVELATFEEPDQDEFEVYYHRRPPPPQSSSSPFEPAINRLEGPEERVNSYQQTGEDSYLDPDIVARRRAERMERNKDDPFYIAPSEDKSGRSTPLHNILQSNNGQDLDLDAIPIMQLDLGKSSTNSPGQTSPRKIPMPKSRQHIQIAADETLGASGMSTPRNDDSENSIDGLHRPRAKGKQSLLQVDSSHIGSFSLEGDGSDAPLDFERQQKEEAEMAKAMKDVERLRLEMQRANERIEAAHGVEGTVIKKKKKKSKVVEPNSDGEDAVKVVKKKKKAKKIIVGEISGGEEVSAVVVKPKKKKKPAKVEETHVDGIGSGA